MVQVNVSDRANKVATILFQNTKDSMFTGVLDLTGINYKKNLGDLLLALLTTAGFDSSSDGKAIWHKSAPGVKLGWRQPAKLGTRQAADARPTLLGRLQGLDLTHDDGMPRAGSRAANAAAAAARPPAAPKALPLAKPAAADRIGRNSGTGHGNVPRAISECCVVEQSSLDDLVARVQHAVRTCSSCAASLCRVHSNEEPHWSCCSVGLVNVCRFECATWARWHTAATCEPCNFDVCIGCAHTD